MTERPIFQITKSGDDLVKKINVEFSWFPGFSIEQKQKSIESLHMQAAKNHNINQLLEISTKSKISVGINASAFNLKMRTKSGIYASVESFYQGSKVFSGGGPYTDIYKKNSLSAKKDERLRTNQQLISFEFFGTTWGLDDHFYDWLYLNALLQNEKISNELMNYQAFSDIEFNPKKSFNCQAYSAALYCSAQARGFNLDDVKDPSKFKKLFPRERLEAFQPELPL